MKLIQAKLIDQEVNHTVINNQSSRLKVFASSLVILSGLILFSDKVTTFGLTESYGFKSTKTFIWVITQTLSPLLLCCGGILKPYKISYTAPIYFYFIQLYWVFNAKKLGLDDVLLHVYALGFTVAVFVTLFCISILFYLIKKINSKRLEQLKHTIHSFFHFLYKEAEEEGIINPDPEKTILFKKKRMKLTDKAVGNE
ncbi:MULTISPECIES: hypothetical protein [Aquimarina]|uniref:hypothetical protein n=1 Tax=Aquimarina TaxID=290174 RepID=UPI0011AFAA61|nr:MULTISPECIES: hypothetical protein [Aquimarina]